jgi:hypothetical protein
MFLAQAIMMTYEALLSKPKSQKHTRRCQEEETVGGCHCHLPLFPLLSLDIDILPGKVKLLVPSTIDMRNALFWFAGT